MNGLHAGRCLSAARALLAGAAILASAATQLNPAKAEVTEDAMALPRLRPPDGAPVALPRPLSGAAARALRAAFQDPGAGIEALRDDPATSALVGPVLAERLLAAPGKATGAELSAWLERFPGQPDAPAIHALLLTKLPKGAAAPPAPDLPVFTAAPYGDDVEAADPLLPRNPALDRSVREAARAGQADRALRLIARTRGLSAAYGALLRAEVAQALFSQGHEVEALEVAGQASVQCHGSVALAPFVAGLSAWRLGRSEAARTWFEAAWRAGLSTPSRRAAAAFWAARANLLVRGEHGPWMHRAAQEARTFYGLLARQVLGQPVGAGPGFTNETLSQADVDAVAAAAGGMRAFALLQADQPARAAAELRLVFAQTRDKPGYGRSVLRVARAAGLDDLAGQLAAVLDPAAVRLPDKQLVPAGGFRLDPSLVYALTRLESNFDAAAVSPAGARGLMQLMPQTARFLQNGGTPQLHNPATNLQLGQRYLLRLSQYDSVGPDLIRVLAAYNAGPGNFARWMDGMRAETDPLLFLEALPGDETRAYVLRALAYSWLYAAQFERPARSLEALANGLWPSLPIRTPGRRAGLDVAGLQLH